MEQSITVGLVTFFLGLIIGHRLTLWRDRRKEFNELTSNTYFSLKSIIDRCSIGVVSIDADRIEHYIPIFKRVKFRESVMRYSESQNGVSAYFPNDGSVTIDEAKKFHMIECAKDVLHYLVPR